MAEHANEMPNQNGCENQAADFLEKAGMACANGDQLLGMHLYLAAYEQAVGDANSPVGAEVMALREAWHLACDLKERSLAEYVFEKLEPYLTGDEIAGCAMKLQELALDRLEQYGFSREDLEDMAESISQDLLGDSTRVVKVESVSIPNMNMFGVPNASAEPPATIEEPELAEPEEAPAKPPHTQLSKVDPESFNPYDEFKTSSVGTSYHSATNEGSGSYVFTRDEERANAWANALESEAAAQSSPVELSADSTIGTEDAVPQGHQALAHADAPIPTVPAQAVSGAPKPAQVNRSVLNYRTLVGYDGAIAVMRDIGVGLQNDTGFLDFVRMLNTRHGLDRMPAIDTLMFRSPAVEDAARFAEATIGELELPVLRMSMEEGAGGVPVLCVTTQGNNRPRMNHAHNRFDGPSILVIEDLDTWSLPEMPENADGFSGFVMANISRGAREAVNLIRSAVEDPEVFVLATTSINGEPDPFFYELLEPITIVDIGCPNEKERADIWREIANDHPSMRGIDQRDLTRFSEGLARFDIYMAAREAIEEAYKSGLVQRTFIPVTPQNVFDKLAACQPLDSDTYHALEDAVVNDFRTDLDHLDELFGSAE